MAVKPVLGRGLGALLGGARAGAAASPAPVEADGANGAEAAPDHSRVRSVPWAQVRPSTLQPRKEFTADALRELADSIKEKGIVQPLIVRPAPGHPGGFELIAGERRWRAAQQAGLAEVPVIVREAGDREVLELALIENLQRENLNPVEEAEGFARLIKQFNLTQEMAAAKVGRSRVAVANALRLLKLTPEILAWLRDGKLSTGHAKVILSLSGAEEQNVAATRVLQKSMSVRQTEELVAGLQNRPAASSTGKSRAPARPQEAYLEALRAKLQERFGTKVALHYHKGQGALEIKFYSDDDLERILAVAGIPADAD